MSDTRRKFLTLLAGAGTLAMVRTGNLAAQSQPPGRPHPPQPPDAAQDTDEQAPLPGKSQTKMLLESNEKDIKKNVEKLYQLATDLKEEIEKTDTSKVLSLTLVKKAEEIEKLAHDIKTRAKG